jgi:hypothetical protein
LYRKYQFNVIIHPATKKYNQYNEICKNKIIKQYDAHYEIRRGMCVTETETAGKEKGVTKDRKGMLITENYKNVHSGHGHGVSWEKSHE